MARLRLLRQAIAQFFPEFVLLKVLFDIFERSLWMLAKYFIKIFISNLIAMQ